MMKKLLYLFVVILVVACATDDEGEAVDTLEQVEDSVTDNNDSIQINKSCNCPGASDSIPILSTECVSDSSYKWIDTSIIKDFVGEKYNFYGYEPYVCELFCALGPYHVTFESE